MSAARFGSATLRAGTAATTRARDNSTTGRRPRSTDDLVAGSDVRFMSAFSGGRGWSSSGSDVATGEQGGGAPSSPCLAGTVSGLVGTPDDGASRLRVASVEVFLSRDHRSATTTGFRA